MATINSIVYNPNPEAIPGSAADWLAFEEVDQRFFGVGDTPVSCGVFKAVEPEVAETVNIFVGGVPRNEQRWPTLPVINKFFGYVAVGLALDNCNGVSFNWPGLGDTPGSIRHSSIDSRTDFLVDFAQAMLDEFNAKKINFIGASMGAYCAALASAQLPPEVVHKQAFLSLPAYPESSHGIAYADGFGDEIRRSWEVDESPVYDLLATTTIPTMIAYSEHDDPPIPQSIQDNFRITAQANDKLTHHIIEGVYHNFRRTPTDMPGEAIDNAAVRSFGDNLIAFMGE